MRVAPACDPVVVRFGPATWQMDRGEIVLRAANGQVRGASRRARTQQVASQVAADRQSRCCWCGSSRVLSFRRTRKARTHARRPRRLYRRRAGRRRHRASGVPRGRRAPSPALYDLKADPAKRELFSFEEDGEPLTRCYWLRCRTRDDLARRMRVLQGDRRRDLRLRRPLARPGVGTDHRARHESGAARRTCSRASAQNLLQLLRLRPPERSLSQLRRDAGERHARAPTCFPASSATIPTCRWSPRTTPASPSPA